MKIYIYICIFLSSPPQIERDLEKPTTSRVVDDSSLINRATVERDRRAIYAWLTSMANKSTTARPRLSIWPNTRFNPACKQA